ncbi:alkaline phosphatase, tissue-nonspecific isozyme [Trichonephila inaurata madagascariensis]|uniref:alkaline phosphatase n=1 Tax=Trichonephila inaurata madagascariensis TaxID=2747483 RepID=A0A8X6WMH5_9ARAC|nr:alkaline phosphatase, tissue-nonspecific isozyme [Trichonephila inaurata madagascariensis]
MPFLTINRWYWYQQAKSQLLKNLDDDRNYNVAKNLILFIGDGMGMTTVTTSRILRGQKKGQTGEESELAFDKFEYVALSKTYNTDSQVGDSGACATALLCGVKGRFETVGLDDSGRYDKCQSSFQSRIPCLADWAQAEAVSQKPIIIPRLISKSFPGRIFCCDSTLTFARRSLRVSEFRVITHLTW